MSGRYFFHVGGGGGGILGPSTVRRSITSEGSSSSCVLGTPPSLAEPGLYTIDPVTAVPSLVGHDGLGLILRGGLAAQY